MAETSVETLKTAVQALYRVHAVEGPPGENGLRTVWHLCPDGAELMSLVDSEGRVRRQELTLLEDHYVWASGEGVRTGYLERGGGKPTAAAVVQTDPELVPQRLMRAALAMGTYTGQDRYLLHMQRVLALAREGLEMKGGLTRPSEPTLPAVEAPVVSTAQAAVFDVPPAAVAVVEDVTPPVVRRGEGVTMLLVLALGLLVGFGMLAFILMG
ncbi:hypothetical protein MYXA107069_25810 [Myxococcus xanthus]|nr:hypothetical protein MyxoNM_03660 [Myxococcus xanthus]SDW54669.1 hypothetical protein SAMN05444383_102575 [Myxococcus xanthus]